MSIFRPTLGEKRAMERQGVALLRRIRENFWLKIFSLAAAILLYFFVQQERNPNIPRTFTVPISLQNMRPDVEVETDRQQVEITLTGPRPIIESLKAGDIHISADMSKLPNDKVTTERIPLICDVNLPTEMKRELIRDPDPMPSLKVESFPQRTIERNVEVHFKKATSAGVHYGRPLIHPSKVKITGRADRIDRVERAVVEASADEPGTEIDGEFAISAVDREGNPVADVTLTPAKAQVRIPLEQVDYSKIVSVSPLISDLPQPTHRLASVSVEPNQVRVIGQPELVNPITTLTTEEFSVHDLTESQTIEVRLTPTSGVQVKDLKGNPISTVKVRITIVKVGVPSTAGQPTSHPETNLPPSKPDSHP